MLMQILQNCAPSLHASARGDNYNKVKNPIQQHINNLLIYKHNNIIIQVNLLLMVDKTVVQGLSVCVL